MTAVPQMLPGSAATARRPAAEKSWLMSEKGRVMENFCSSSTPTPAWTMSEMPSTAAMSSTSAAAGGCATENKENAELTKVLSQIAGLIVHPLRSSSVSARPDAGRIASRKSVSAVTEWPALARIINSTADNRLSTIRRMPGLAVNACMGFLRSAAESAAEAGFEMLRKPWVDGAKIF